jgi:hypothetical protein
VVRTGAPPLPKLEAPTQGIPLLIVVIPAK